MEVNDNPVLLRDPKAARLVRERAEREHRSAANAAAVSIIEHLGKPDVTDQRGQK
ncbi:MAG: hypothetical protein ACYS6W_01250 [Planctomycetota bacterium]|jgi:hypothetical protein